MGAHRLVTPVLLLFGLACGCSQQKTLSTEELTSEITSALSLASEAQLLTQVARSGRTTQHYVQEHAESLQQEAGDTSRKLEKPVATAPAQQTVSALKQALQAVSQDLAKLGSTREDAGFAAIEEHVQKIREQLATMKAAR